MITFPPEVPFYCMACRAEHPAAWTYRGGCYAADGWYEGNFDGDDVSEAAWKEFARLQTYFELREILKTVHRCGHTAYEYKPILEKEFCFDCQKRMTEDRDDGR